LGSLYHIHAGRAFLQQRLGKDCFNNDSQQVGNFWSILETRPYMRVLQALVRLYFEEGRFEESAYVTNFCFALAIYRASLKRLEIL
jgi:hypothetical protein